MNRSAVSNRLSITAKIVLAFVMAAMLGGTGVSTAVARDDHDRMERHDNGRYENRGRGHDHGHYVRGRRVYRTEVYRERVYAPPPVVYAPAPLPGIGIFFPPIIIH